MQSVEFYDRTIFLKLPKLFVHPEVHWELPLSLHPALVSIIRPELPVRAIKYFGRKHAETSDTRRKDQRFREKVNLCTPCTLAPFPCLSALRRRVVNLRLQLLRIPLTVIVRISHEPRTGNANWIWQTSRRENFISRTVNRRAATKGGGGGVRILVFVIKIPKVVAKV